MADTYWLSFRLHDSDGYEKTYNARLSKLDAEINASSGNGSNWWFETTSFFVFSTEESIDTIVLRVKRAIDVKVDLVIIGMTNFKGSRAVGHLADRDILTLIPHMKKV